MSKKGFTILELALAMAFISFLLLAIGLVSTQVAQIYAKGVILKTVDENGRELSDELMRAITASRYDRALTDSEGNGLMSASHFNYTYTETKAQRDQFGDKAVQFHGAFCLGNYSYVWNTGYALKLTELSDQSELLATLELSDGTLSDFRFLRVNDPGREICVNHARDNASSSGHENEYRADTASNPVELLSEFESDLVLYDLALYPPTYHELTGDALFSGSLVLGTLTGGVDINAPGSYCTDPPTGFNSEFTYCAVNRFNFVARATGGLSI